jgi:hypothetical protein
MIELKAHDRAVASFEALVERLGPDAFASPKRSTVPLLDYWRVAERRLRDLGAWFGVSWSDQTELHFEYEVPVQRGRGKSSYTDLMITGNDVAVAIEAKSTESRYESVGTWLGRAQTTNRGTVLDGWAKHSINWTSLSSPRGASARRTAASKRFGIEHVGPARFDCPGTSRVYTDRNSGDRRVQRNSAAGNWMVGPPSSWSRDQEGSIWAGPVSGPLARRLCVVPSPQLVRATARLEAAAITRANPLSAIPVLDSTLPAD